LTDKDNQSFLVAVAGLKEAQSSEIDCQCKELLGEKKDSDAETCRLQIKVAKWDKESKNTWWNKIINPPESMS
jgi:hypothetical protein